MQEFDNIDKQIIQNGMFAKSNNEIAILIGADVKDVANYIASLSNEGLLTKQMRLDKARGNRPLKLAKPKRPGVPPEEKRKQEEAKKLRREQSEQSNTIVRELHKNRQERKRKYKTLEVDYSVRQTIRIDSKTQIVLKPGETEEQARNKYYKNQVNKIS